MLRPRKAVERLQKYRPPLEGRGGKMRMDFNENTVGCAPEVITALQRALTPEAMTHYPEYEESRQVLARYFGVSPDEMLVANGTDDAINLICDAFVDPDDILLVPAPTFPVYQFFHSVAGGTVEKVRYDDGFQLPVEKLIAAIHERTRWVALANPNNPTGTMFSRRDLEMALRAAPETLFLVDEAYYDFAGETVLPCIKEFQNLVVTRTFSKAFGLAALRIGCIFAHAETAEAIRRAQNPFPVSSLALACACEAVKHDDFVKRYAEEVCRNRADFCRKLEAMGIPYVPSRANFVLTHLGGAGPEISKNLRERGILVRDWSYDPNLKGYVRFTIGSTAQTQRLIEELEAMEHLLDPKRNGEAWRNLTTRPSTGWVT